jgi:hypothetical protein
VESPFSFFSCYILKAISLGRNPLSDAPYQNPGMVLNEQGPGRHPLSDAPSLDLEPVISEQGSGRRILSGALHPLGLCIFLGGCEG